MDTVEKKLSPAELKKFIFEYFASGAEYFPLQVSGNSMSPFLTGGRDSVFLKKFSGRVKRGDIVLYERGNGELILHRLVKKDADGLYFAGDNQSYIEGPLSEKSVIAFCAAVVRKGKRLKPTGALWRFFSLLWIRIIPFRRKILKICSLFKAGEKA